MSKYDFKIDLSTNTSTGLILSKIEYGSTVLEFGCATGRMTKYMKEALGCKVYIVEYDKSAYDVAINYAEDGLCDDILNFKWGEKFKNVEFDAIIFADVLEHLTNPEETLIQASKLLKENGQIYISIPNVTHNDVLLKEFENQFNYTSVGILDNTHVHFWGYDNIIKFADTCDLKIGMIEATYCPTGISEQYAGEKINEDEILLNYFRERRYGEAYQFIFALNKYSDQVVENINKPTIKSHIYLDTYNGFNQEEIIEFDSQYVGPGEYNSHYMIDHTENVHQIRFDPIEYQSCILSYISVRQNGEELPIIFSDSIEIGNLRLFNNSDPMAVVNIDKDAGAVIIDAQFIILGEKYIELVHDACINQNKEINRVSSELDRSQNLIENLTKADEELKTQNERFEADNQSLKLNNEGLAAENQGLKLNNEGLAAENQGLKLNNEGLAAENQGLKQNNEDLTAENESLGTENRRQKAINENLQIENNKLQAEINILKNKMEQLQSDLGAYIVLANKKDECLIEKDRYIGQQQ